MAIARFGVSLESELLEALDDYVVQNNFPNRSQAIRQLIERNLVERKWQCNHQVAGAITLVYDHHKRDLGRKITDIQHDYFKEILAVQHFHLSHETCMEIIAVKGQASRLTELADKLISQKGIQHGKLVMTKTNEVLNMIQEKIEN
jgi:CopG family nickel-responsive transcriptional regulator